MTLPLSLANTTNIEDVPEWMFKIARERPGMYSVRVNMPKEWCCPCESASRQKKVVVNLTGEEFAKLDKVIMNQTYAESKSKVMSAIIFQHATTIWPSHTPDDVTMRTLGAWAIAQYRNNGTWFKTLYKCLPFARQFALCCSFTQKQVELDLKQDVSEARVKACGVVLFDDRKRILCGVEPPGKPRAGMLTLPCGKKDPNETDEETAVRETQEEARVKLGPDALRLYKTFRCGKFDCRLFAAHHKDVEQCAPHSDNLLNLKYRTAEEIRAFGDNNTAECLKQCFSGENEFDSHIFELPYSSYMRFTAAPQQVSMGSAPSTDASSAASSRGSQPPLPPPSGPPRNDLGYVEPGHGSDDLHPLGGSDAEDSQIRAERQDRIVENSAGVGVVGQSMYPRNPKQIVGVLSLPVTDSPNVYAKEADNIESAIENRIHKKQRPFTATTADRVLIGRVVSAAIGDNPRRALFSARKVVAWWEKHLLSGIKSGKWPDDRLNKVVEGLCQRINPQFRLSCDIKLEPMPEGKAPRMLIADGDEGQVMALMTICCIEDLIKQHMPKKTIKGLGKRAAMERCAAELRVPNVAYSRVKSSVFAQRTGHSKMAPPGASVFEGDGSAWDTTCSAKLRECVENPVINHVASILKTLMVEPPSWTDAHVDVCELVKLSLTFKKNNEFRKFIIDAIRRSGHRGTSCLNWWENFVGWHVAIFETPEIFLDPDVRYGRDHTGIVRWIASCFEGDDSVLSTTPKIVEDDELYVIIIQRWERLGFNMKIFIRDRRALFTGYYLALDNNGPTGIMMPEIDRCFARAGISCSPTMIKHFNDENRSGCQAVSRAAALSRAYEFAGWSPTISVKYLRFYESMSVKTHIDRDLKMRTVGDTDDFSELDIITEINTKNGSAMSFDTTELDRLSLTGFGCTQDELLTFTTRMWDYDLLKDWDGFRESLPETWRSA